MGLYVLCKVFLGHGAPSQIKYMKYIHSNICLKTGLSALCKFFLGHVAPSQIKYMKYMFKNRTQRPV